MKEDLVIKETESENDSSPLALMGAAAVLPGFSPSIYRHANRKPLIITIAFFLVFSLLLAGVETLRVGYEMREARQEMVEAFDTGEIPEFTLQNGRVTVNGPEPFIAIDDGRNLVVIDTTGQYTGNELREYESGVIVTKDTLYSLDDQGAFHVTPLADIQRWAPERITVNAQLGQVFFNLIQGTAFFGLAVWHAIIRPFYVTLLALGVWAVAALVRRETSFKSVLVTGLLAAVPALYGHYLLDRAGVDFFGLFTLLMVLFWAFGLVAAVGYRQSGHWLRGVRSLRAWRALIGLPMLVVFALDLIYNWSNGATIVWITAGVTSLVLIAAGYQTGMAREEEEKAGGILPQA